MQTQISVFNMKYLLRPMQLRDSESIHALHERASANSLYYRFLRSYTPYLRDAEMMVMTGKGLVLTDEQSIIIGYAYYVPEKTNPSAAEFAVLVDDKYQGQGLGRYLLTQFCEYAFIQGIDTLKGTIHGSNDAMKHLVHRLGYPIHSSWDYSEYIVTLDLSASYQNIEKMPERA